MERGLSNENELSPFDIKTIWLEMYQVSATESIAVPRQNLQASTEMDTYQFLLPIDSIRAGRQRSPIPRDNRSGVL